MTGRAELSATRYRPDSMRSLSLMPLVACTLSLAAAPALAAPAAAAPEDAPEPEASADTDEAPTEDADPPKEGEGDETPAEPAEEPAGRAVGPVNEGSIGGALRSEAPQRSAEPKGAAKLKLPDDLDIRVIGSIAFGAKYKSWPNAAGTGAEGPSATFERVALGIDGQYRGFVVNADYRFYGKYGTLHHAYIGYKHKDVFEIDGGVHRVPFGILPYASHNWFETLPYYVGLADDYDLGVKATVWKGGLNLQFAYYAQPEPAQFGATSNSARYSYDLVATNATEIPSLGANSPQTNEEKHTGVARVAYAWAHRGEDSTEIGASGQFGGMLNTATRRYGTRWAAAVHYVGWYRNFNLQVEGLYYDFSPQNPTGQPRSWVTLGAWDAPYRVASEGFIGVANVAYRLHLKSKVLDWIMFYNDHSLLWKRTAGFDRTHMNVTGILLANRFIYTYIDAATGRNHPWFSPNYEDTLAEGDTRPRWWVWLNLSIGFYM